MAGMPPHPVLVVLAAAAYLYATGDGLCTWGLGLRPSPRPARVVLGVAAGLVVHVALAANLYLAGAVSRVDALVPWFPLALGAISLAGWLLAPARASLPPAVPARLALPFLVPAGLAAALVLSPTLGGSEPGFYSSNNGEFSSYAAAADLSLRHPFDVRVDLPVPLRSREGIAATLVAVVARTLAVPPLLTVQPLAALLAALFFAGLASFLAARAAAARADGIGVALAAALLAGHLLSGATLQVWTASFFSQYLAFALLGALLAWLPWASLPAATPRGRVLAAGIAGGVLSGTAFLAYPEMAPLLIGAGALFASARWRLGPRALAAAALVASLVALATGPLGLALWRERLQGGLGSGWNFFGHTTEPWLLATNVLGFTNRFWGPWVPEPLPLAGAALLAIVALARGAGEVRAGRWDLDAAGSAALALYLLGAALLFGRAALAPLSTNYVAAKFATAFLWIPVVALAPWAFAASRATAALGAAICVAIVVVPQLRSGAAFARGLARDAAATRLGPSDLGAGARVIPPGEPVFLLAPDLPKYRLDALYVWKGSPDPDPRGRVLHQEAFEDRGQPWIVALPLREDGRTRPLVSPEGAVPVVERPGYAILRRR
jgi:hypothetical protein